MKKKFLLFTLFAGFSTTALMSYSSGPASSPNNAGNRTGSPGAQGTCASSGCHNADAAATTGAITVKMKGGTSMENKYMPGKTYVITITGSHATFSRFGYQIVALNGSNANIGTFANPSNSSKISLNTIVEHAAALPKNSSGNFEASVEWTAPATSSGPVTFYGIINAVNANGQSSGDAVSNRIDKVLADGTNVADVNSQMTVTTYPNPATNKVAVKIENAGTGTYTINAFDLAGKKMMERTVVNNSNTLLETIEIEKWAAGLYHVQIMKDGVKHVTPIMKN
ncbi:MAG: T9SS type A sorting domain-containing protein [Sphingobacteriales bacterium]|nr:MAG: T9SS type A sorting domain-containing protein [Sphingobacteriales bacterium]